MGLAVLAAGIAAIALPSARSAQAETLVSWAGSCVFSPQLPVVPLVATFNPNLSSLSGSGECVSNGNLTPETVTLTFSGGSGLTCVGGDENLFGEVLFGGATPPSQTGVLAIAVGGPGALHLVLMQNATTFVGTVDLAWASLGCPGSFSTATTGTMSFAEN